ncbi:hypothetical protein RclHR1_00140043 [Rhizophagus clarus]|uniref:Phosphatidylglycerol/phosphatidylinositol transfer protein n=1 Tax=Rhizophagus clarus TaxID=94130 RepID=A0A2Z6QNZ5_9GLOM|nr:hypothetical protein RclHR1_00140043 [Rhizophagus clarus]
MNNLLLVVLLIFITFASSTPMRRQDTHLKQCEGTFPNEITSYGFKPYPIIVGQLVTNHVTGKVTVPVEEGATVKHSIYYNNQLRLEHTEDFCSFIVIPSGHTCPVTSQNFDYTVNIMAKSTPNDPKNVVLDFFTRTLITNPDGRNLTCIEQYVKYSFP